jgi:hypothetical protein
MRRPDGGSHHPSPDPRPVVCPTKIQRQDAGRGGMGGRPCRLNAPQPLGGRGGSSTAWASSARDRTRRLRGCRAHRVPPPDARLPSRRHQMHGVDGEGAAVSGGTEPPLPSMTKGSGMAADPRGEGACRRRRHHRWDLVGDRHRAAGGEGQRAPQEVRGREHRACGGAAGSVLGLVEAAAVAGQRPTAAGACSGVRKGAAGARHAEGRSGGAGVWGAYIRFGRLGVSLRVYISVLGQTFSWDRAKNITPMDICI